jgi:PmbA protein
VPSSATNHDPALGRAAEAAVGFALKAGAQQADALVESGSSYRVDVLEGRIENLKQAQSRGLGLRVFVDRKSALVYTSDLRESALQDLARRALALAGKSTADESAGLPDAPPAAAGTEASLRLFDPAVAELSSAQKIELARALEKATLGYDKRILRTDGCTLRSNVGATFLASSLGQTVSYRGTAIGMFVNPLADDGLKQQSGSYGEFQRRLADLGTPDAIGTEAARRAVERIGARTVPTQRVPVVLHPDVAANWMQGLSGAFSGEQAFKKVSYLTDRQGQAIASNLVTLVDDGVMPGGVATTPFDGEGMPTRKNVLIEAGTMKMFTYDSYWARKAGAKSTGNANRGYQGAPGIGSRNLYLAAGRSTPEEILQAVERGLFVVDTGAFGYNPTTGAYSYAASGFWIERGAKAFPVTDATIASTTLDMLKNVAMVGNDLRFNGQVNAPTILISEMTVSGREATG